MQAQIKLAIDLTMAVFEEDIEALASTILKYKLDCTVDHHLRLFKAHFCVSPFIVSCVWNRLEDATLLPSKSKPFHLLWTLLFLKLYCPSEVLAGMCGTTGKTYRQWIWRMLDRLEVLPVVSVSIALLSVDRVVCVDLSLV